MKRAMSGIGAVVVGIAMLTLPGAWAHAEQRPGMEAYVVRRGDTLSKISGRVFGDVKRWREILKENPQVTNANRIFPGDILLVPAPLAAAGSGGELAAGAGATQSLAAPAAAAAPAENAAVPAATSPQGAGDAPAAQPGSADGAQAAAAAAAAATAATPAVNPARAIPVVNPALYRSAGAIADNLPPIAIIASQDERILIGSGDAAIINAAYPPGTRFTVVRAERRIIHPMTHKSLGWLIRVLGAAEVTCRGEHTSTVVLRSMNDACGVGDYLVPFDEKDVLGQNALPPGTPQPGCLPPGSLDGVIVAFNEVKVAVGNLDLAYIDRGSASGVAPGQRFTIYREVAPEGRVVVGELQVLRAGLNTSTALITSVAQEVHIGYLLRAR